MATPQVSAYSYFQIKPFKDNELGVLHWEKLIKNLISLKAKKIAFIMMGNAAEIKLFVKLPRDFESYFKNTFYTTFTTSDLVEVDKVLLGTDRNYMGMSNDAVLKLKDDFSKDGSYMDPMNEIFATFQGLDKDSVLKIVFEYTFKIEEDDLTIFLNKLGKMITYLWNGGAKKTEEKPEEKPVIDLYMNMRWNLTTSDPYVKESITSVLGSVFAPFLAKGSFEKKPKPQWLPVRFAQVINLFHLPTKVNFVKGLEYTVYRKLPYPTAIPTPENTPAKELTVLGDTDYRGDKIRFGVRQEDKFRHMYIVGKTGTGKSTFINNMIISDMRAGNGLCLLDPHGELVDDLLEYIPSNRINDVILFDVGDAEYPIGFNLLQADNEDEKNRIASGVVSTFQKLFDNSRGPRLEYILRNVVLSVIDYPNATLMHILRILTDKEFREEVISHVKDPVLLKFWNNEFNRWQDKQREEAVGPITNKVGQFLSSRLVRNIFGQPRTKLSIRRAMDEGKIILVNLSKGKIGEDNANMIGSLLVTKIQIDAMGRADMAKHLRKPFYLYIDEFQNFATKSFATILSEARKYKLSLIVANQYTSQLDEAIKDAIFGNVGTIFSFTLGYDDASVMTSQFKELVSTNDLISLPKFTAYTRLMVDGVSSDPFSMKTLPPFVSEGDIEHIEKIRKQSRQRYAMEREQLEALMNAWNKKTFSVQEKIAEKARLEGLGITEKQAQNLQDIAVQQVIGMFDEVSIGDTKADAMIVDTEQGNHKMIWYQSPKALDQVAKLQVQKGKTYKLNPTTSISFFVDIWQHLSETCSNKKPLTIWVGTPEEVQKQLNEVYEKAGLDPQTTDFLKFVPNIALLEEKNPQKKQEEKPESQANIPQKSAGDRKFSPKKSAGGFSIEDVKLGSEYEGYVKLTYNYGMFVTVKGVEGLLHKKQIKAPDGVDWKKYYNIGDKILVKALEFKDINGEKRVLWTQL
ncbi:DUF87 domain-containing protein [Candidatus Gracilibacteria bacterium]|nr:MAG: DUF87 domain-containing protein [Candidatus Gracilibacteria bacterium]